MKYPETARRLREAMSDQGIKAVELSEKTGLLKSSLSQYMNGSHSISNKAAGKIAEILGVDPVWLMGFDVPKYKEEKEEHYTDPEATKVAQQIFDDKDLHALFDAAQDSKPEDLQMAADLLRRLKATNPDG